MITLELQHIVTHAEIVFYTRGEMIIRMGDGSGGHLNVIQTGYARVSIKDNLFSLGAFRIKEGRVRLDDRFETFVNPRKDIPPETIKQLGIVPDMVKDAPDTAQVIDNFLEIKIHQRHSAVSDTLATAMIFQRALVKMGKAEMVRIVDLINS